MFAIQITTGIFNLLGAVLFVAWMGLSLGLTIIRRREEKQEDAFRQKKISDLHRETLQAIEDERRRIKGMGKEPWQE